MNKQKNNWAELQDAALTILYQQRNIEDWDEIARILVEQYNFIRRDSKQCKQRYMSNLNSAVFKIEWSTQEERLFMKLHVQIGNKWATIAHHLVGKTDNCVKNHFYSKLRKLLRKLNKIIQFYLKKQFKPIDISIMYKIVEAAQQRFKQKPNCELNISLQCLDVQNQMLEFAMSKDMNQGQQEQQLKYTKTKLQQYKQLIQQICRVSKLYKRKSKKVRNSLIQAPVNNSKKRGKKQTVKQQEQEDGQKDHKTRQKVAITVLKRKEQSDQGVSANDQVKGDNQQGQQSAQVNKDQNPKKGKQNGRIQVQEGQGIQQLLRTAGILHDQVKLHPRQKEKNPRSYPNSQCNPIISSPSLSFQQHPNNFLTNPNAQQSPHHSFTSLQVQNFLGFPMINNGSSNGYANFILSEKSSFKSYSQIDPLQIENPFFDYDSLSNGRMMFPMNFSMPANHQYQETYHSNNSFNNFAHPNVFFPNQTQPQEESQKHPNQPKRN